MNIILIGNNGAGKSTIANKLYKEGYHLLKEAPLGKHHAVMSTLCLTDHHIVFDRWNVIDRMIYEQEEEYFNFLSLCIPEINRNNLLIYLVNEVSKYNPASDPNRSIQRPSIGEKNMLDYEYTKLVSHWRARGLNINIVYVCLDEKDTYNKIKDMIRDKEDRQY